jgi:glucose dehydrogenase
VALDAKTGKELWRFHTVPESPDDPVWKTWHAGGSAAPGGGGFWSTFSLEPKTGEVFGPVANPAPDFDLNVRPGDNLYTNSVIAVDAATGRLNWYFQATSPDDHDWDLGSAPSTGREAAKTWWPSRARYGVHTRARRTGIVSIVLIWTTGSKERKKGFRS